MPRVIFLAPLFALAALPFAAPAALADDCKPAAADAVAAAERKAADADAKASQLESVAVRSGNPGAQARADQARADATAASDEVARLKCQPIASKPQPIFKMPARGY